MFVATDVCKLGNQVWFVSDDYNALNWLDLNTEEISTIGMIPWEKFDIERLFFKPFFFNDQLIITPYNAKSIAVYNINDGGFNKIEIGVGFSSVCMLDGAIYAVSAFGDKPCCLYKYDFEKHELSIVADLGKQNNKFNIDNWGSALITVDGKKLFFCMADTNTYFIYDSDKEMITAGIIPGEEKRYHIITKCPEGIFAVTRDKPYAILFSEEGAILAEYTFAIEKFDPEAVYSNAVYKDKKMYLNYILSDEIYEIDLKKDAGKEVQPMEMFSGMGFMTFCGDDLVLIPTTNRNEWLFQNGKKIRNRIPYNNQITKMFIQKKGYVTEQEMSLKSFMEFVVNN